MRDIREVSKHVKRKKSTLSTDHQCEGGEKAKEESWRGQSTHSAPGPAATSPSVWPPGIFTSWTLTAGSLSAARAITSPLGHEENGPISRCLLLFPVSSCFLCCFLWCTHPAFSSAWPKPVCSVGHASDVSSVITPQLDTPSSRFAHPFPHTTFIPLTIPLCLFTNSCHPPHPSKRLGSTQL